MDILLRNDGLDLQFIQHNLIAFTKDDGINKFTANSVTIYDLKKKYSKTPIKSYLSEGDSLKDPKILERRLDTYMKSLVGQTVATYLLGIGDRHLENLMIT